MKYENIEHIFPYVLCSIILRRDTFKYSVKNIASLTKRIPLTEFTIIWKVHVKQNFRRNSRNKAIAHFRLFRVCIICDEYFRVKSMLKPMLIQRICCAASQSDDRFENYCKFIWILTWGFRHEGPWSAWMAWIWRLDDCVKLANRAIPGWFALKPTSRKPQQIQRSVTSDLMYTRTSGGLMKRGMSAAFCADVVAMYVSDPAHILNYKWQWLVFSS